MLREIFYTEGAYDYIALHLNKRKISCLQSMQEILQKLPADNFFRIHKSFIVSFEQLVSHEGHQVKMIIDKKLPVGNTYRQAFAAWIGKKHQQ